MRFLHKIGGGKRGLAVCYTRSVACGKINWEKKKELRIYAIGEDLGILKICEGARTMCA